MAKAIAGEPGRLVGGKRLDLQVGDSVRHSAFGEGVVTGVQVTAADTEVTIEFAVGVGLKRLLLSFAPLEKV